MVFDGTLKDLLYECTFTFDKQTYALCRDGDDGKYFCVRLVFHPLDGYRYQRNSATARALRIAEQIVMLFYRSPEKYRLLGEHYDITVLSWGERIRFRIQCGKSLVSRQKNRWIPYASRFALLMVINFFVLWLLGGTTSDWLSVLLPSIPYESLGITVSGIQIAISLILLVFLSDGSFWVTAGYAFCPALLIISTGFFIYKGLTWLFCTLLCIILGISLWILFGKSNHKHLIRLLSFSGCGFLLLCGVITFFVTTCNIKPYPYESGTVMPPETSYALLEERYIDACAAFEEKSFSVLKPQEKLDILQTVCDYECIVVLGCDSPKVCAEWIDKEYIAGQYRSSEEIIVIDIGCLQDYDAYHLLSLLLHELRHHYQHRVSELYDALLPYLSEKNQNIAYLREAKDFKLNYSNYKDYEKDGKEAYRDQYIEKDSRDYADKRMDEHYRYVLADIFD